MPLTHMVSLQRYNETGRKQLHIFPQRISGICRGVAMMLCNGVMVVAVLADSYERRSQNEKAEEKRSERE